MSDELLVKIDSKLDQIREDITDIRVEQAKQGEVQQRHDENLKEHMHRSDLLEESQEILYEEVTKIKLRAAQIDGILKFFGVFSTIITGAIGLLKLFHKL